MTDALAQAAKPPLATLEITVEHLRSDKGTVALLLCPADSGFPNCQDHAVRKVHLVIARGRAQVRFTDLAPGNYAIAAFHDANSNQRLDTFLGIPREGYGFSGNPAFKPRAPRFSECAFGLSGAGKQTIAMRYMF